MICGWPECRQLSELTDHVEAVEDADDPLFWQGSNHLCMCWSHHNVKTIRFDGGYGRPRDKSKAGIELFNALLQEAKRRAEIVQAKTGGYAAMR